MRPELLKIELSRGKLRLDEATVGTKLGQDGVKMANIEPK